MLEVKPIKWVKTKANNFQLDRINKKRDEKFNIECMLSKRENRLREVNKLRNVLVSQIELLKEKRRKLDQQLKSYNII